MRDTALDFRHQSHGPSENSNHAMASCAGQGDFKYLRDIFGDIQQLKYSSILVTLQKFISMQRYLASTDQRSPIMFLSPYLLPPTIAPNINNPKILYYNTLCNTFLFDVEIYAFLQADSTCSKWHLEQSRIAIQIRFDVLHLYKSFVTGIVDRSDGRGISSFP